MNCKKCDRVLEVKIVLQQNYFMLFGGYRYIYMYIYIFRILSYKMYSLKQVREMVRCVKVTAANLDNLSLIPRIHIMVRENQRIPSVVLRIHKVS